MGHKARWPDISPAGEGGPREHGHGILLKHCLAFVQQNRQKGLKNSLFCRSTVVTHAHLRVTWLFCDAQDCAVIWRCVLVLQHYADSPTERLNDSTERKVASPEHYGVVDQNYRVNLYRGTTVSSAHATYSRYDGRCVYLHTLAS